MSRTFLHIVELRPSTPCTLGGPAKANCTKHSKASANYSHSIHDDDFLSVTTLANTNAMEQWRTAAHELWKIWRQASRPHQWTEALETDQTRQVQQKLYNYENMVVA